MVLGEVDYGLVGLIGGLSGMISMLSWIIAAAIGRFYCISIGAVKVATDKLAALEECRHWFNTAVLVHFCIAVVLIAIGYPIGLWAIKSFLNIPVDRIVASVWVFRFVCVSCFFGMASIPFYAMYQAKQYIAELTIYGFVTQTIYVSVMYYMLNHPGDWLITVSIMGCLIAIVPTCIVSIRACWIFPECKFNFRYMLERSYLKRIANFSSLQLIDTVNTLFRDNLRPIVVNKFFGAAMNASLAIGTTVQNNCNSLSIAMQGAFTPAITQAYGAKDFDRMRSLTIRASKLNVLMNLVFVIPLALELPEVLRLWLKNPPQYTTSMCLFAMIIYLVSCCATSHHTVIYATGKIGLYNTINCVVSVLMILFAVAFGWMTRSVYAVMTTFCVFMAISSVVRVYFAWKYASVSIAEWLNNAIIKPMVVLLATVLVGLLPHLFMQPSFVRVCLTTCFCESVFLPMLWFVLTPEERMVIQEKFLNKFFGKFRRGM